MKPEPRPVNWSPRRPKARTRLALARGFTAVEVLIAMTIMFIGAAAVMTMQKTSIQGNLDARRADVATSIARAWVERIRRESMRWTQPSASSATSNQAAIPALAAQVGAGWFKPTSDMIAGETTPSAVETSSYGFDILGRDLAQADINSTSPINVEFCTEARITALLASAAYRVDVRVIWPRGTQTVPNAATPAAAAANFGNYFPCIATAPTFPDPLDYTLFHAVIVTTAIAENAAP
jgi:type II secretory pathway pseudopilin PulG